MTLFFCFSSFQLSAQLSLVFSIAIRPKKQTAIFIALHCITNPYLVIIRVTVLMVTELLFLKHPFLGVFYFINRFELKPTLNIRMWRLVGVTTA
jgi:hypothetical protein